MFDNVQPAPPDAILGLSEAFNADANPDKINLSVGVYKDAAGKTPVLDSVHAAERKLADTESSKSYRPIHGSPTYAKLVQELMFGAGHHLLKEKRVVTAHTPGGTGALRVAADYIANQHASATVYMSDPTWANHPAVFAAAGLKMETYAYYDAKANALDFQALMKAVCQMPMGSVILLHGCCHNPTGVDLDQSQWQELTDTLAKRGIVPLLDFAYQGFADGLQEDAVGLHTLAHTLPEFFVCSSYSKNFGLYNERVGALSVVAKDEAHAQSVLSHIKKVIRCNYSNPPAHGANIVETILSDEKLTAQWMEELSAMRQRINGIRQVFADRLSAKGIKLNPAGNDFITAQKGMFSFSGLNKEQVGKLRDDYSIYIVGSGRINVAGITEDNVDRLVDAIAAVV